MLKVSELAEIYSANIHMAERWLAERGITVEQASIYMLGYVDDDSPESRPYRGRVAIPYLTPAGVIDIRFRSTTDRGPKYLSRPGAEGHLYNVGALWRDSDVIAICEGEFDTMVMDSLSGIPAVGVPGVKLWKKHYRRLFQDYERILVIGDGDDAGREFSITIASQIPNAIPVLIDKGHDINSLYVTQGQTGVVHLTKAA